MKIKVIFVIILLVVGVSIFTPQVKIQTYDRVYIIVKYNKQKNIIKNFLKAVIKNKQSEIEKMSTKDALFLKSNMKNAMKNAVTLLKNKDIDNIKIYGASEQIINKKKTYQFRVYFDDKDKYVIINMIRENDKCLLYSFWFSELYWNEAKLSV